MFEAAFEAQIGNNNVTITRLNNTMREFMTSMCPTDITNWLLNIQKPRYIKVKEFVTHVKEIYHLLPFLPPPFNSSLTQEELFATIKKSIPSFERLFCTNNLRTTITTLNQLETYYMDLEEVNPPSNNQPHGCENNHHNNRPSNHHHGRVSNNNQHHQQKSSNNQQVVSFPQIHIT